MVDYYGLAYREGVTGDDIDGRRRHNKNMQSLFDIARVRKGNAVMHVSWTYVLFGYGTRYSHEQAAHFWFLQDG